MNNSNKRRFKRLDTNLVVTFRAYDKAGSIISEEDATAINMSKTGLLLQTNSALTPHMKLDITMNVSGVPVHLKCQCMYCSESENGSYESGIHVLKINKKEFKSYLSFIDSLETSTNGSKSLRPRTSDITDLVQRISAEHKIINQYVVVLAKMMKTPSPSPRETETLMGFMKQDIAKHFNIEENLFFNVGICTLPEQSGEVISGLTADHKEILQRIDDLIESMQYQIKNNGPVTPPLKEKIGDLLETVKQHAKIELLELFPMLENNPEAKKRVLAKVMAITKK